MLRLTAFKTSSQKLSLVFLSAVFGMLCVNSSQATTEFQKVFVSHYIKDHSDSDFSKFVKRKARCLVCHQGKNHKINNAYGDHLAKLLDHELDKKDTEKVLKALKEVENLPWDAETEGSETYAERIAASKLPAGELEDLKKDPEVILFDGKTFKGWIGSTDGYEIRDGILASRANKGGNLYTEKEYAEFILRFEFRLTPGANNGIGILAPRNGDAAYQGIELQVLDNSAEKYANLKPYQYHGSAYGIAPAKKEGLKAPGEWNEQEIRLDDRKIRIILNKKKILDVDLDKVAPDGKTIDGSKHPGLSRTKGHIGFLGHSTVVEFRNIRIVDLTPVEAE